jgi:long-chain acyl-CoA synthetase
MLNLAVLLENTARDVPDRDAIVFGGTRLTYAQVNAAASQVASALAAHGIGPGDKVALSCPNLPHFPVVYFGILKAGATVVPLNVLLTEREIAYHLRDSGAVAYFCFEGTAQLPMGTAGRAAFESVDGCEHFILITARGGVAEFTAGHPVAFETVQTSETDTAIVLYTSGTTGTPKGAELTHSNMVQNALMVNRLFEATPDDIYLVTLPLFHVFGLTVQLNGGLMAGATLVMMTRFEPGAAFKLLQDENVTFFAGVPTMYWSLLHSEAAETSDLPKIAGNLRLCVSGGSALPVEVLKEFEARFGVTVLEGYGLSETSPVATFNRLDRPRRAGSIGLPVWGVEVKVVRPDGTECDTDEVGEIVIRGHNVMKGYLGRPEATAEAIDKRGWFHSGDLARRDADGYLFIVDRIKDMIIRGGFNVYPREIEELLVTHPDVSLAAVVGVPHESHGEEVKAFVIRVPGASVSEEELVDWCKERLAAYKYPRIVEFRDSLPMTATGKILKRELA